MKINKLLISNIKEMNGNILVIGDFHDDVLNSIQKNTNIYECNILSNNINSKGTPGSGKTKKVQLNNLRKSFKKKKIDFLICDYDKLNKYLKTFIRDTIYITKNKIYFCTNNVEDISRRYKRYDTKVEVVECSDKKVIIIDVSKAKNKRDKEIYYSILDTILEIIDAITNLLLN